MKIQQTIDSGSDTIDQRTVHCPYCPSACTHYKPVRPSQLLPSACSSRHFAGIDQIAPRDLPYGTWVNIPSSTTGLKRPLALGPPYPFFWRVLFLGRAIGTFPEFPVFFVGTVVWRSTCPIPPSAAGRLTISLSSRTWLRGIIERRSPAKLERSVAATTLKAHELKLSLRMPDQSDQVHR
jgi:hypothetical protein